MSAPSLSKNSTDSPGSRKRLIFRLSSLGDIILATAALAVTTDHASVDWVVSKEYAGLLAGHPVIRKVWTFDRRQGLGAWITLCRELASSGEYEEILDLHASLRTRFARLLFLFFGKGSPRWSTISKSRWRRWGYCAFKSLWPRMGRPIPMVTRFAKFAGGSGAERPDLRHLLTLAPGAGPDPLPKLEAGYVCVMPGARWPGKCWPVEKYVALLSSLGRPVVVLGTDHDAESVSLARTLSQLPQIQSHSLLGQRSFTELARILAGSAGYLGNDTGLGHLAEAVGVPALMVFGPTASDFGFGPWRKESRAVGSSLWCRPCGKDGRACFRVGNNRYLCLKSLAPAQVEVAARAIWPNTGAPLS